MWNSFYSQVTEPLGRQPAPIPPLHPFYVIVEAMGNHPASDDEAFSSAMTGLFTGDCVADGVIAKSQQERAAIWAIRHDVEWIVSGAHNFDVSLRVADVGDYISKVCHAVHARRPDVLVAAFGHLGDNNVHVSAMARNGAELDAAFIEEQVYGELRHYGGAISAEHGIGLEKRGWLHVSRSAQEIHTMRLLKQTLDPHNILNPGKVFATV
jgi:FAD/FMN-containing dehydrogenase